MPSTATTPALPDDPMYPGLHVPMILSPKELQANDPTWSKAHPEEAILDQYQNHFNGPSTQSYAFGENLRNKLLNSDIGGQYLNQGAGPGALAAGLAGGAAGLLGGGAMDMLGMGDRHNTGRMALTLALLGAGIGGTAGYLRTNVPAVKTAAWDSTTAFNQPDPHQEVLQAIRNASDLSFSDRNRLAAATGQLSQSQALELMEVVREAGGAAVGGLIARYFLHLGFLGTAVGALIGGLFARPSSSHNALGFPSF